MSPAAVDYLTFVASHTAPFISLIACLGGCKKIFLSGIPLRENY
jgi:hypothetical protein